MPIVQITLVEGRDTELMSECVREVARTISRVLGAPLASIRVFVHLTKPALFAVGDKTKLDVQDSAPDRATQDNSR